VSLETGISVASRLLMNPRLARAVPYWQGRAARSPSPRRGEGRGEGNTIVVWWKDRNPLTRLASRADLSPPGRGEARVPLARRESLGQGWGAAFEIGVFDPPPGAGPRASPPPPPLRWRGGAARRSRRSAAAPGA